MCTYACTHNTSSQRLPQSSASTALMFSQIPTVFLIFILPQLENLSRASPQTDKAIGVTYTGWTMKLGEFSNA